MVKNKQNISIIAEPAWRDLGMMAGLLRLVRLRMGQKIGIAIPASTNGEKRIIFENKICLMFFWMKAGIKKYLAYSLTSILGVFLFNLKLYIHFFQKKPPAMQMACRV